MTGTTSLIVNISGIRGIVGESLTDDTVRRFAHALATELPLDARVVLARDTRPSGAGFADVAAEARVRLSRVCLRVAAGHGAPTRRFRYAGPTVRPLPKLSRARVTGEDPDR